MLDERLGRGLGGQIVSLGAGLAAGGVVYLGVARLLRIAELEQILRLLRAARLDARPRALPAGRPRARCCWSASPGSARRACGRGCCRGSRGRRRTWRRRCWRWRCCLGGGGARARFRLFEPVPYLLRGAGGSGLWSCGRSGASRGWPRETLAPTAQCQLVGEPLPRGGTPARPVRSPVAAAGRRDRRRPLRRRGEDAAGDGDDRVRFDLVPRAVRGGVLPERRHVDLHFIAPQFLAWFYPANSELVHAVGMLAFGRDLLSPLLNLGWFVGLPGRLLVHRAAVSGGAVVAGARGVALSVPALADQAGEARNDIVGIFFLLAAVAVVLNAGARPTGSDAAGAHPRAGPLGPERWSSSGWPRGWRPGPSSTSCCRPRCSCSAWSCSRRGAGAGGRCARAGGARRRRLLVPAQPRPHRQPAALGPPPRPDLAARPGQTLGGREAHSVLGYLTDGSVWSDWFLPGLHGGLWIVWPLLGAAALAGLILCLVPGAPRRSRVSAQQRRAAAWPAAGRGPGAGARGPGRPGRRPGLARRSDLRLRPRRHARAASNPASATSPRPWSSASPCSRPPPLVSPRVARSRPRRASVALWSRIAGTKDDRTAEAALRPSAGLGGDDGAVLALRRGRWSAIRSSGTICGTAIGTPRSPRPASTPPSPGRGTSPTPGSGPPARASTRCSAPTSPTTSSTSATKPLTAASRSRPPAAPSAAGWSTKATTTTSSPAATGSNPASRPSRRGALAAAPAPKSVLRKPPTVVFRLERPPRSVGVP